MKKSKYNVIKRYKEMYKSLEIMNLCFSELRDSVKSLCELDPKRRASFSSSVRRFEEEMDYAIKRLDAEEQQLKEDGWSVLESLELMSELLGKTAKKPAELEEKMKEAIKFIKSIIGQ